MIIIILSPSESPSAPLLSHKPLPPDTSSHTPQHPSSHHNRLDDRGTFPPVTFYSSPAYPLSSIASQHLLAHTCTEILHHVPRNAHTFTHPLSPQTPPYHLPHFTLSPRALSPPPFHTITVDPSTPSLLSLLKLAARQAPVDETGLACGAGGSGSRNGPRRSFPRASLP